jgi:hypothetical protein
VTTREPIGKRLRFEIFKRDRFRCTYCGKKPPEVMLEIDHVVPVADGGSNDPANLVSACQGCNRGKGSTGLEAVAGAVDETIVLEAIQEALERAALHHQSVEAKRLEVEAVERVVQEAVEYWDWNVTDRSVVEVPSLRRFVRMGVTYKEMTDIMDGVGSKVAAGYVRHKDAFRYFAGAIWNHLRGGQ